MTSPMIPIIKAALVFNGIAAMSLFLMSSLPIAVDFSVWSSFLSWLKPPYPFVVINVIIITIVAISMYYRSIGNNDGEGKEILHGGEYQTHDQNEPMVSQTTPPRRLVVNDADVAFLATFSPAIIFAEVERSEEMNEEKEEEEENSRLINGGDEFVVLPPVTDEPDIDSPVKKHLVLASSGHRKLVKVSVKGDIMASRKEALRVERPKRHETTKMENTLKMIPEGGKFEVDVDAGDVKPALRNSEIFKDVANNYYQSTVKPPVKMKKEMDRKFEVFIKKVKKERRESLRLDKEMA